jgi:hypothetical protein
MDKPNLIFRPTVIGSVRQPDDFAVFCDGHRVGRIRLAAGRVGHNAIWEWTVSPPLPIPSWCSGSSSELEQAKAAFRASWESFYACLTLEEIARWRTSDRID